MVRMVHFYDNVQQAAPEDFIHFQKVFTTEELDGMSALDIMNATNDDVVELSRENAGYYSYDGRPLFELQFSNADGSVTSTAPTDTAKFVRIVTNPKTASNGKKHTFPFSVVMSPLLSTVLGFKNIEDCVALGPQDYYMTGHVQGQPYEFTSGDHLAEPGFPSDTIPWQLIGDETLGYIIAPRTAVAWNKVEGQELLAPATWFYKYTGKDVFQVIATNPPWNMSIRPPIRPISSYSNALILVNHEPFDDQGGKLHSGCLLGNNTLYLELKRAAFRRQYFRDYTNAAKPDDHLLLYPTFAELAQRNELDAEGGANIRMDSWVHHDLRTSIQAGGIMNSFY